MNILTAEKIDQYSRDDSILKMMNQFSVDGDDDLVCQAWLRNSLPKRYIYNNLYGDLIHENGVKLKILDVGGGLSCFSRQLLKLHDYKLVDILSHQSKGDDALLSSCPNRNFLNIVDWSDFSLMGNDFDYVIANDLFPNVDQRLNMFLQKFLPYCKKMRLSLTWYDDNRFYAVKRMDADEVLTILAWGWTQLDEILVKYKSKIIGYDANKISPNLKSVYPNRRQVCIVEIEGGGF